MIVSVGYAFWTLPHPPPSGVPLTGEQLHDSVKTFLFCSVGILIGVFFAIVGFTWDVHSRLNDYGTVVKDLGVHLDNVIDCRYLGIGSETLTQVMSRLANAKYVRNTFVFFGVAEHDLASASYAEKQIREAQVNIKGFLKRGGTWTDIVSQEFANSPTMNWLKFLEELRGDAKKGDPEAKAAMESYNIRRLKGLYPVINFMLLRYANGDQEVIFGWGHHSEDSLGRVFLSHNRRLIDTFDLFWRALEKDSTPFDPRLNRPISAADVAGLWFRVAYRVDDEDHNARTGVPPSVRPPNPDALFDVALVRISVDNNREIVITGRRFDPNDHCLARGVFTTFAADIKRSKIWFSTTSSSKTIVVSVAGWYRFIRPMIKGFRPYKIQEFYGEFLDFESSSATSFKELKAGKLILFGKRVPTRWLKKSIKHSWHHQLRLPLSFMRHPIWTIQQRNRPKMSSLIVDFPSDPADQIALVKEGLRWWEERGRNRWTFTCGKQASAVHGMTPLSSGTGKAQPPEQHPSSLG